MEKEYSSEQNQYFAHGTNAAALRSILSSGGNILPGEEMKKLGITPFSGESIGQSNLNSKGISVIELSKEEPFRVNIAEDYAKNTSIENYVVPSNIDDRIQNTIKALNDFRGEDYVAGSPLEDAINTNKRKLDHLYLLKNEFQRLDKREKSQLEELSKIPVVLFGKEQSSLKRYIHTDIYGEVILPSLKVELISVPKKYFEKIKPLLKKTKVDANTLPMEEIENYQDYLSE